jgi:hypothetical protein
MLKENLKMSIREDGLKAVWMPPEVHSALKKLADKEKVKIHNLVAMLINNYIIYKDEARS